MVIERERDMTDNVGEVSEQGFTPDKGRFMEEEALDDDGRARRTGTAWTANAHIITAVIGSGVLSLAWAIAQLGWIAGPATLFLFSFITFFTSTLLADCYRSPDPVYGKRNYTYTDAMRANLGGAKIWICGLAQYFNLFRLTVGYTITASTSMAAVQKSNCFHRRGHDASCKTSNNPFMIGFGILEILVSNPKLSQAIMALHFCSIHVLWLFLDWCRACIGQSNLRKHMKELYNRSRCWG